MSKSVLMRFFCFLNYFCKTNEWKKKEIITFAIDKERKLINELFLWWNYAKNRRYLFFWWYLHDLWVQRLTHKLIRLHQQNGHTLSYNSIFKSNQSWLKRILTNLNFVTYNKWLSVIINRKNTLNNVRIIEIYRKM